MTSNKLPPPINIPSAQRKCRFYLSTRSNENDGNDEVEQKGMVEAFSHLETLTTEDWSANLVENERIDYSTVLKYSRTDDTSASNFGKSTEEEVLYYLEMQQQLEGIEAIKVEDDEKISVEEGVLLEVSDVDDEVPDFNERPWKPINPILRLRGPVATGYGRGGKQLGVPTANVSDTESSVKII